MDPAYLGLAGRITLLGVERILVKKLGTNADATCGAFLFFLVGGLVLLPFALMQDVESFAFAKGPLLSGAVYALALTKLFGNDKRSTDFLTGFLADSGNGNDVRSETNGESDGETIHL